jgi:hypothetical protein
LAQLARITEVAFQADQAKMRAALEKETRVEAQLAGLKTALSERADQVAKDIDPAFLAGADLRWKGWVDRQRSALNLRLARLRAERAEATDQMAQAFGRNLVADRLVSEDQAKDRKARAD